MKVGQLCARAVRISWALLGGAWGAWLGFGGYLRLPHNPDSFAAMFAIVFFSFFAWVGLFAGAAVGAAIGTSVDLLLRRLGAGTGSALSVATLVTVLSLWQIAGLIQVKYPGLRAQGVVKQDRGSAPSARSPSGAGMAPPPARPAPRSACSVPPPAESRERAQWDSECR